jgi:DNA polymerase-1
LVGFNLKYDLHWLRRYSIDYSHPIPWDCQIAQFIIECQTNPYPSLEQACEFWGLGKKLDVVRTEYWEKGIDTPDIPWNILSEYAAKDVELTRELYYAQKGYLADKPKMEKLIELDCLDMLVLQEMEWNGLLYDVDKSLEKADELKVRMQVLESELSNLVASNHINWNSGDQVSAVLYGGSVTYRAKEKVPFTYKDGRTAEKEKWVDHTIIFPRLVEPLPKSDLKKDGLFQTGSPILKQLKAKGQAKEIITMLIELADLEKQVSTYLEGLPKLINEMGWSDNIIHGNLNQCVAVTGRLSSSRPNMQNNPASIDKLFKSRHVD